MNDSAVDLEQLQSQLLDGTAANTSDMFNQVLEPMMPMLTMLFFVSIILTIIIVIFFIINIIQKQRQHAAIMRIDRNLQVLVDKQTFNRPVQQNATIATTEAQDQTRTA